MRTPPIIAPLPAARAKEHCVKRSAPNFAMALTYLIPTRKIWSVFPGATFSCLFYFSS